MFFCNFFVTDFFRFDAIMTQIPLLESDDYYHTFLPVLASSAS